MLSLTWIARNAWYIASGSAARTFVRAFVSGLRGEVDDQLRATARRVLKEELDKPPAVGDASHAWQGSSEACRHGYSRCPICHGYGLKPGDGGVASRPPAPPDGAPLKETAAWAAGEAAWAAERIKASGWGNTVKPAHDKAQEWLDAAAASVKAFGAAMDGLSGVKLPAPFPPKPVVPQSLWPHTRSHWPRPAHLDHRVDAVRFTTWRTSPEELAFDHFCALVDAPTDGLKAKLRRPFIAAVLAARANAAAEAKATSAQRVEVLQELGVELEKRAEAAERALAAVVRSLSPTRHRKN